MMEMQAKAGISIRRLQPLHQIRANADSEHKLK